MRGVDLVEGAVRSEIPKGAVGQAEPLLDPIGGQQGERHAGALQHMHHPEEAEKGAIQ